MNELERVYRQTSRKHINVLSRILRNYAEAEDVFQEAVCRAIRYYPTYKPELSPIKVWFSRIVFNELSRHLRKNKKTKDLLVDFDMDYPVEELSEIYNDIVHNVEKYKDQKDMFTICSSSYIKGYSTKEICEATGYSERFVRFVRDTFKMEVVNDSI